MRIFKKTISGFLLVFFLSSSAYAVIPFIYWAASIALHAAVIGGITWLQYKPSDKGAVSSTGDVFVGADVQWINTADIMVPETKQVTVKKTFSQVKATVASNPTKYPKLKDALGSDTPPPVVNVGATGNSLPNGLPSVGDVLGVGGAYYRITAYPLSTYVGQTLSCDGSFTGHTGFNLTSSVSFETAHCVIAPNAQTATVFTTGSVEVVSSSPSTPEEFKTKTTDPTGEMNSDVRKEVEEIIRSDSSPPVTYDNPDPKTVSVSPAPSWAFPPAPTAQQIQDAGGVPSSPDDSSDADGDLAKAVKEGITSSGIIGSIVGAINSASSAITSVIGSAITVMSNVIAGVRDAIYNVSDSIRNTIISAAGSLSSTVDSVRSSIYGLYDTIFGMKNTVDQIKTSTDSVKGSVDAVKGSVDGVKNAITSGNGSGSTLTPSDIATGVKQGLQDHDSSLSPPSAPGDNEYSLPSESDLPEKKNLDTLIHGVISTSPLAAILNKVTVDGYGESSFSFDYRGRSITFDFSPWSWILSAVGTAMLSISHVYAVYIVFKGGES